ACLGLLALRHVLVVQSLGQLDDLGGVLAAPRGGSRASGGHGTHGCPGGGGTVLTRGTVLGGVSADGGSLFGITDLGAQLGEPCLGLLGLAPRGLDALLQ